MDFLTPDIVLSRLRSSPNFLAPLLVVRVSTSHAVQCTVAPPAK